MTTETSRNSGYAPFAQWSVQQAPVPQSVHNLPGSVAGNAAVTTSLIKTDGFTLISAGITLTQNGQISIQRFLDDGGTQIQGPAMTAPLTANVAANLDILDGKPFSAFTLTVTNASSSAATVSGFALLLQSSAAQQADTAVDGSTTITAGGAAQTLFGGVTPANGYALYNPDPVNDLWVAEGMAAAANAMGSVRVEANGGWYETPQNAKPLGAVSVYGAVTGQKLTARRW